MQLNIKIINNSIEKRAEEINRCFQRRNTNDQQVPAKMFTITRHQGSANKTHHEITPQSLECLSSKRRVLARMPRKANPLSLLAEMCIEFPQKS